MSGLLKYYLKLLKYYFLCPKEIVFCHRYNYFDITTDIHVNLTILIFANVTDCYYLCIQIENYTMKTKSIRIITFVALVFILFLQGFWLYNTYKLLDAEFEKNISKVFIHSLIKEDMIRFNDPIRSVKWENRAVYGVHPDGDDYVNNRALQDWLYNENYPLSFEKVDSIFNAESKKSYKHLNYSFTINDSLGKQTGFISNASNPINKYLAYKETIQLRNIAPEYITLVIASPYKIIFGKMLLMLIGSVVVALFITYSLIWQIMIINKQDTIAKKRQDFTHSMIHDLKNPVASIVSGIASLKSGKLDDKPESKAHHYAIITKNGERILRLVNKVLEVANLENMSAIITKSSINLPDLLSDLKDKYQTNVPKPIHFHIELNGVENIYADQHYIYEVFDNLIENAVKYSKGNEDADITIRSVQKRNETQLSFKDLGIGIADKDQKKIFQKFERSMAIINSKKEINGFGLGLNFVYQVIKAHGGTIKVNSRLGSYSEFIIDLPNKDGNDKTVTD